MKSKLITRAGYKKRQEEHDYLWKDKSVLIAARGGQLSHSK
ncbi:hypothetical protein [Psychromonas sp. MB-3u-54]|nr:hypothetical protein [Psychromonas sp. MB-3u-54]